MAIVRDNKKPEAGKGADHMRPIIMLALTAALIGAGSLQVRADRIQPDFTFRRVAVPSSGSGNRITVQIDPDAPLPGNTFCGAAASMNSFAPGR